MGRFFFGPCLAVAHRLSFLPNRCQRAYRFLACALLLGALGACSTLDSGSPPPRPRPLPAAAKAPQLTEEQRWAQRLADMTSLASWRVKGKVAYRLPDDAGSANLDWRQNDTQSALRLFGPLGVGSTEIRNSGALLRVERDGIERLFPADAAPWLPGGTLLPIPIDSIQHWLKGVPDPSLPISALEIDDALATRLEQNGWIIQYENYEINGGTALPTRLNLTVPDAELRLKIILRAWDLPSTAAYQLPSQ